MAKNIVICGLHSVQAYLDRHPEGILEVFLLKGRDDERMNKLVKGLRPLGVTLQWRERGQLDELAGDAHHQGAVARVREQAPGDENDLVVFLDGLEAPPFLLLLDGVTDPHNLGACLRVADAMGVHAVIAPKDKSAPLNATVSKVACGAAEVMPYIQVTNLARTLREMKDKGIWIVGTDMDGSSDLYHFEQTGPLAWVLGAEGHGMRRLTREYCDALVSIPMYGTVESLNVSVATGIVLAESRRQRQLLAERG